jgi:glutathione S-transferase
MTHAASGARQRAKKYGCRAGGARGDRAARAAVLDARTSSASRRLATLSPSPTRKQAAMKLYADPITVNCRKVLAGLDLIGAPFERVHVDYFKGEQKSPAYVAINPNAALPALVDGDFTLWESNAILAYAADKHGNASAYPTALQPRADVTRWLLWESSTWFPACYALLVEHCVKPILGAAPDAAAVDAHVAHFHKVAPVLEARLANHAWVIGTPGPTIADIALAAPMHLHAWQRLPLERYPNVRRWMFEGVEQLACWKKTWVGEGFKTR